MKLITWLCTKMYAKRPMTLNKRSYIPKRQHKYDAGLDLTTPVGVMILPHSYGFVDTGVHIRLRPYEVGLIRSRSGLMRRHGIFTDGVVDSGYTGSIGVTLFNMSDELVQFNPGDRIAQMVVMPVSYIIPEEVKKDLKPSDRGNNGFGSTGI